MKAKNALEKLDVEVRNSARVTNIDAEGVSIGDERIFAKTVLWAAGVKASPISSTIGAPADRAGRIIVNPDLSIPNHQNVFVVGDVAAAKSNDKPVPGVAQGAMQGGECAAKNIMRLLQGKETQHFHYNDKGSLATIGRSRAVAQLKKASFSGFLAWLFFLCPRVE